MPHGVAGWLLPISTRIDVIAGLGGSALHGSPPQAYPSCFSIRHENAITMMSKESQQQQRLKTMPMLATFMAIVTTTYSNLSWDRSHQKVCAINIDREKKDKGSIGPIDSHTNYFLLFYCLITLQKHFGHSIVSVVERKMQTILSL